MSTLQIKNLHVQVATNDGPKPILKGVDLTIDSNQVHAIMGPNGSGKSTLAYSIAGHPDYEVTDGEVLLDGVDLLEMSVDERARAGLFLAMQYPVEVPGVTVANFLRTAKTAIDGEAPKVRQWVGQVNQAMKNLRMDPAFSQRDVNAGFSGGEKKRFEILQMELLRPRFAVLDETDSGLDVDALSVVSKGIQAYRETCDGSLLIITHNTRILERLEIDRTHVMVKGHLVADGPADLINQIDHEGFERFENQTDEGGAN